MHHGIHSQSSYQTIGLRVAISIIIEMASFPQQQGAPTCHLTANTLSTQVTEIENLIINSTCCHHNNSTSHLHTPPTPSSTSDIMILYTFRIGLHCTLEAGSPFFVPPLPISTSDLSLIRQHLCPHPISTHPISTSDLSPPSTPTHQHQRPHPMASHFHPPPLITTSKHGWQPQ